MHPLHWVQYLAFDSVQQKIVRANGQPDVASNNEIVAQTFNRAEIR